MLKTPPPSAINKSHNSTRQHLCGKKAFLQIVREDREFLPEAQCNNNNNHTGPSEGMSANEG